MSRTTRLAWNTASNVLRLVASMAVWVAITPAMLRALGTEGYGLWQLASSVLGFFQLLDVGFGVGVVRTVGQSLGSGDIDQRNRMLSTYLLAYAVLGAIAAAGLAVLAPLFPLLFDVPAARTAEARLLLVVLGLRVVVLALPLSLYRGVLVGSQRLLHANLTQVASQVAYGALVLLAVQHGATATWLAVIGLITMIAEHAIYAGLAFRWTPGLRVSWRLADPRLLRGTIGLSATQLVIAVSGLVLLRTDPLIVQLCVGLEAVAIYTIALRVAEQAFLGIKQFVNALSPIVAEMHGRGDESAQRRILLTGTKAAMVPATMLAAGVFALGEAALRHWVGPEVSSIAPVMSVLVLAMTLTVPQEIVFNLFTYTDRFALPGRAAVAGAVVNLAATLLLVRPFGLLGVALGTLAATIIVDVVWVLGAACRAYTVPYREYAQRALLPALLPMLADLAVTRLLVWSRPPASLFETAAYALPGLAAYAAAYWATALGPDERDRIKARLLPRLVVRPAVA